QGKQARVPLYGHEVPIVPHPSAKPEFGSAAAMVCSYGDMVDLAIFRELRLEPLKAIDETGRMTEAAGFLKGLKVDAALEKAIDDRLADLQASVLSHGDPALVLQEVRRGARATPRKILPALEGPRTIHQVSEVQLEGVRWRGPRLRYLDGLERIESVPHPLSIGLDFLQRELSGVPALPRTRDRPHLALLYDAENVVGAAIEAVPPRFHPRPRARRTRSRDAPHAGERDRSVASNQEARGRRDADLRRERDEPGGRLPDQRGESRRGRQVRHEALERGSFHLLVRGTEKREATSFGRMDPRGT